jgi:outer membrane protein assembly factor BamE (lipoprotein component of BamABCDE complex)
MELLLRVLNFKGKRPFAATAVSSALMGAVALAGCQSDTFATSETLTQGYIIDQQQIDLVPVGSSREQVLLALGTPSTTATFDNEVFYYISQKRVRRVAFAQPKLVDQRVLAVYFGEDGRVAQIANYGMQDGKVFDFVSRTTPTGGRDRNFLSQLLAGVGKIPSGIFGSSGSTPGQP